MDDVSADIRALGNGMWALPLPGEGMTAERHRQLRDATRYRPVAIGRLFEAHTDALAIIKQAGGRPAPDAVYGVWAAGPTLSINSLRMTLSGSKPFCSGIGVIDRALVTGTDDAGRRLLVEVDVGQAVHPPAWASPALVDTATGTFEFNEHPIISVVGPPDFYLDRPGFWHGACGPAACWAGAAQGLLDAAEDLTGEDEHRLAHLGAMRADAWMLDAVLDQAGAQIDEHPHDGQHAQRRAVQLRHTVERAATRILDAFSQSLGPRPFVSDEAISRRFADTHLYLRQHHSQRDLARLGALDEAAATRTSS